MSARREARAAQGVADADADALVSLDSPIWASARSTVKWLTDRGLEPARTPGQRGWDRLYRGARHQEAARLWAIDEGITKIFGDTVRPDPERMRAMGIPVIMSRSLNQARYDRDNSGQVTR